MIQTRQIGRARVTRVLEYSAPTHDPAFLFPGLAQADLDTMADRLAPHHYVPAMNRLIITIQMWVVQIDDKVIIIDTGVGNAKPRSAPRMKNLNIRVGEWLEAAGAGFDRVTHVVQTHLHADHTGWNTVLKDGVWVPAFPNARYLMPRKDYAYWTEAISKAPDIAMDNSWEDSVLPVIEAGLVDFMTRMPARSSDASRSSRCPDIRRVCCPTGCAPRGRRGCSAPMCSIRRCRSTVPTSTPPIAFCKTPPARPEPVCWPMLPSAAR